MASSECQELDSVKFCKLFLKKRCPKKLLLICSLSTNIKVEVSAYFFFGESETNFEKFDYSTLVWHKKNEIVFQGSGFIYFSMKNHIMK